MGLFQFIKDAGAKLFGKGEAQAATPADLKKQVEGHGFDAGKLNIDVQGDQVKLSGQAMTQEEAEKIILSLGNTIGVAQVDTSGLQIAAPGVEATMYTVKEGRHALEDRRGALRQGAGRAIHRDRQGQHAAREGPRPDPARLGAAHPDAKAGATA
jgi:hypothetical protein